jgi:hypothetical protein
MVMFKIVKVLYRSPCTGTHTMVTEEDSHTGPAINQPILTIPSFHQ